MCEILGVVFFLLSCWLRTTNVTDSAPFPHLSQASLWVWGPFFSQFCFSFYAKPVHHDEGWLPSGLLRPRGREIKVNGRSSFPHPVCFVYFNDALLGLKKKKTTKINCCVNVIFVFSFTELFCLLCFLTSCCCYCYIEGRSGIRKVEKELTICRVLEKSPSDMLYVRTCCNIKRKKEKARAGMKCCCTFYDCDSISTWRIVSVPFYLILSVGFSACATVRESALLHGWVTQHSRERVGDYRKRVGA